LPDISAGKTIKVELSNEPDKSGEKFHDPGFPLPGLSKNSGNDIFKNSYISLQVR
jgi:hypothetical protein